MKMHTQQNTTLRPLVLAVHLSLAGLAITLATPSAHAAPAASQQISHYHLAAGPLVDVLARFAAQAKVQLSLDPAQIGKRPSPGLHGDYSADAGFDKLLAGSGFAAVRTAQGYSIKPVAELPTVKVSATAPAAANPAVVAAGVNEAQLPTVRVSAAANPGGSEATATSPVKGYVAKRSATATKTDTPIIETPRSITVVGTAEMAKRGADNLNDALGYVSGVTPDIGVSEANFASGSSRGFIMQTLHDGLPTFKTPYAPPNFEIFGMERVEVVHGVSGALYGQNEPGGIVNLVSKHPQVDAVSEIGLTLGNINLRKFKADLGGELADTSHQWRLVAQHQENDFIIKPTNNVSRRDYLAPSLALNLGEDTKLTLLASHHDIRSGGNSDEYVGANLEITGVTNVEPNFESYDLLQQGIGAELEHQLNDNWTFKQSLRQQRGKLTQSYVYGWAFGSADANGDYSRDAVLRHDKLNYLTGDTHITGKFKTGELAHTLLLGVDYLRGHSEERTWTDPAPALNIYNPKYYLDIKVPTTVSQQDDTEVRRGGVYVQDQISVGNWRVLVGVRHDIDRQNKTNRLDNSSSSRKTSATSWQLGSSYVLGNGWVPFFNAGTAFNPLDGKDVNGQLFKPETSQQFEIGSKYQSADGRQFFSAALFDIRKQNVKTPAPGQPNKHVQTGEVHSRGLELEARVQPLDGLQLIANYSYNPVKISRSNDGNQGNYLNDTRKQKASLWAEYTLQQGPLHGLGLGLGTRYLSDAFAGDDNTVKTPAYSVHDAAIWYQHKAWNGRLSVSNLSNKRTLQNASWGGYMTVPREVKFDLSYKF